MKKMGKFSKWLNKHIGSFMLATAKVEQNALSQEGETLSNNSGKYQRHSKGTLADDLINGEITEEVELLRWRMYKILDRTSELTAKIVGEDENGNFITETHKKENNKITLNKIKIDTYDDYPLEMVVNNTAITLGQLEVSEENIDYGVEYPIKITRDSIPKFYIEKFSNKVNIRNINDTNKLIEFYISKYPNEFDRKSRLLISEIKRGINNHKLTNIFDIQKIEFVSNNTIGSVDFISYEYKVNAFDKIIEFDGYYVIKFNCEVLTNDNKIIDKYRKVELDIKYENKEKR